jgi:signal transduction histidine kinase
MKNARMGLPARYLTALRTHLGKNGLDGGDRAQGLDRAAQDSHWRLRQRNKTLRLHAAALASGNRRLEREIARRKAGEGIIRKGKEKYRLLFLESQVMQKKLRQLTRQIIWAQEEERKEISRELHDEVVQTLVGINVQLSALGKGASVGLRALKEKIARTQRLVENSVNAVHRFARELRPAVLDDLGLIPALHAYSKSLAARKKLKIKMTAFGGVEALGGAKRIVFFRVAQEALTNVARHAHATQIKMTISEISGAIRMEISDNGKSFDVGKALSAKNPKRLGLVGMKERVEMVGGTLAIQSTPAKGTTVRAEIPFNQEKKTK